MIRVVAEGGNRLARLPALQARSMVRMALHVKPACGPKARAGCSGRRVATALLSASKAVICSLRISRTSTAQRDTMYPSSSREEVSLT
jgi:hypothetical protein